MWRFFWPCWFYSGAQSGAWVLSAALGSPRFDMPLGIPLTRIQVLGGVLFYSGAQSGTWTRKPEAEDFETSVYTNSTIWAYFHIYNIFRVPLSNFVPLRGDSFSGVWLRPSRYRSRSPHIYQFHHLGRCCHSIDSAHQVKVKNKVLKKRKKRFDYTRKKNNVFFAGTEYVVECRHLAERFQFSLGNICIRQHQRRRRIRLVLSF